MFSDEASDGKKFKLNGDYDFTRDFVEHTDPCFLFIFQICFTIIMYFLSQDLQHYNDKINKLKKKSYATIISSIISFICKAVTQVIVLWWKNLIGTSICRICLIICATEAPGKMLVTYKGASFLLSYLQPVLSDASIVKIVSCLQPSFKLVWSYAIRINGYISIVNLYTLCMFVQYLRMCVSYLNTRDKVLFIQRHIHFIQLLSSLYPVLLSYRRSLKRPKKVFSLMVLQCIHYFVFKCLVITHIPKQLNTNQQNEKVDSQDPIKNQLQLNNELQNATVHHQASMNDEHKQQMLKDTYITQNELKMHIQDLKHAKYIEKAKAESETKKNKEIQQLLKRIHQLELELEHEKRKSQMSNDKIKQMAEFNNELEQKYDKKMETNCQLPKLAKLEIQIQKLKQDLLKRKNKYDRLKATKCNMACVIDVLRHICQTKVVGANICQLQLAKILTKEADGKIEIEDLKCEQFMEVLVKCNIVTIIEEYEYPSEEEDKRQKIDEVWNRARLGGNECVIFGREKENEEGHAELFERDTSDDSIVKNYNPAKDEGDRIMSMDQEKFRERLWDDKGLKLYAVNLTILKDILITKYFEKNLLHYVIPEP